MKLNFVSKAAKVAMRNKAKGMADRALIERHSVLITELELIQIEGMKRLDKNKEHVAARQMESAYHSTCIAHATASVALGGER